MNLLDCYVTKVLSEPNYTESFGISWWSVEVEYEDGWSVGTRSTVRTFKTKAEADEVKEGFHFLA